MLFLRKKVVLDTYKTINKNSEGLYKEKGSKFISYAYHVESVDEVTEIVARLKKEYFDARHHCFAWRMGAKGEKTRTVDDGEPSSTAGKPILGQMLSLEVTDVLIVVIRYFGGILLGAPGLIRAYKEAAYDALMNAEIVEKFVEKTYNVKFTYFVMNDVMKIIKDTNPNVLEKVFDIDCFMKLSIRESLSDGLYERLKKVEGIEIEIVN